MWLVAVGLSRLRSGELEQEDGGGAPTGAEPFTADVEKYDAAAERWEVCVDMRAPVAYHACFAAGLRPLYG